MSWAVEVCGHSAEAEEGQSAQACVHEGQASTLSLYWAGLSPPERGFSPPSEQCSTPIFSGEDREEFACSPQSVFTSTARALPQRATPLVAHPVAKLMSSGSIQSPF